MPRNIATPSARPARPPERREHEALGQQLTHQAPAARPERGPDRHLARSQRAARQQQVGQVGAADQQHGAHRGHQHQQREPQLRPDTAIDPAIDRGPPVFLDGRILQRDAAGDLRHLGLRLLEAHAGLEPRDRVQVVEVPHRVGREGERHEGIGPAPVELPCRQDADDGVGFAIENDIAADDAGVGAELRLPDSLAQHEHVVLAGCVLALARTCARAPASSRECRSTERSPG